MQRDSLNARVHYQSANVMVSDTQIRVGERSHDLQEIDTVSLQRPLLNRAYGYGAIGLGILLTIVGYLVWNGVFLTPMLGGVALIVVGIVITFILRPHAIVRLNHIDGEVTEVPFTDVATAQQVVAAISDVKSRRS